MNAPGKRSLVLLSVAAAALAWIAAFIWKNGASSVHSVPQWTASAIKLKLSLEQDPSAGLYYDRTASAPLPLATIVKELRAAWPTESVAVVNGAALDVGAALLHRGDIEVGELVGGNFSPSKSPAWHMNELMIAEVTRAPVLFENERVYVFRRK